MQDLRASKEASPEMEVDVVLDGKVLKTVTITKENLCAGLLQWAKGKGVVA